MIKLFLSAISHQSKPNVCLLPAVAQLFLRNYKPMNKIFSVVYMALHTAVHTMRKYCSVVYSCLGKAVQRLVMYKCLAFLNVESPLRERV